MNRYQALAHWQDTLRQVLSDYVNGRFLRARVKWAFPFVWGVSVYAAEHALRRLTFAAYPLANTFKTNALTAYLDQLNSWRPAAGDPEAALLTALADGYCLLSTLARQQPDARPETLHLEREFDASVYRRADPAYFSPVVRLGHYIQEHLEPYLALAAIHGSIGDLHYTKGYSDLDTWLVLAEATATDATRLREFARKCYRSLTELYRFDPLQHHGHMIATAIDWQWYSENWLPLDTFRHACRLTPDRLGPVIRVRNSAFDAHHNFEDLHELMSLRYVSQWQPESAYALKEYLSILMLAPALYLQAKGQYVAKQDSFQLAHDHLPDANWDSMRYATQARNVWPYYRSRSMEAIRLPNVHWLDKLQRTQVERAYRSTVAAFSPICLRDAAELTQQMTEDIERSTTRIHALRSVRDDANLPLFIVNHPLLRQARDYEETRERYITAAQQQRAVLGIYQYGNITYPGLSDLDLMLCVSDAAESIVPSMLAIESLSPLDQNVMLHSPMVMPISHVPYVHEFLIDANLRKIWGPHDLLAEFPATSGTVKTYAKLAKLFETLFSDRIWLSEVLAQGILDARWAIPSLKSIIYSCNIMESVSGRTLAWASDYRTVIQELRENWFLEESLARQDVALRAAFRHSVQVVIGLLVEFDSFVRRSGWLSNLDPRLAAPITPSRLNVTIAFEEPHVSDLNRVIAQPRQISFPKAFWQFLSSYRHAVDNLDSRGGASTASSELVTYLQGRVEKISQQMRFLKRHHLDFGGYLPWQLEQILKSS